MLELDSASLLILLLLLVISSNVISFAGKDNIQAFCWKSYASVAPRLGNEKFRILQEKSSELRSVTIERKKISAQDEFAKWTKLNRKADSLNKEIEQITEDMTGLKGQIDSYVNLAIRLFSTMPLWFCRFWYRKQVLFYLPAGVFPYILEWLIALPFTKVGGIGLSGWLYALNSVFSSLIFLVSFPFSDAPPLPQKSDHVKNGDKF